MSTNNRILIASPCYDRVDSDILEDWMRLAYHCGRRMPEYEFFLGIKSKSEQFRARNVIVEAAQQNNCDWILMIDDDMKIDAFDEGHEAYNFLPKLIAHDKDICGVLYYQRGGECNPVLMTTINDKGYRFLRDDEIEHKLQKVAVAGGGCLLIKTRVFDRIQVPYFAPEYEYGTDVQLCRKAAEKGFEIWADTSIEFGHNRNEKATVTSRNKHQFQDTMQIGAKHTFVMGDLFFRLINDAKEYTEISSIDEMWVRAENSLDLLREGGLTDAESYRQYPIDRICRQVWFNTQRSMKKKMTEFVLASINHNHPLRILEFGSGIGLLSLALAEKGHNVTALDIRGTATLEFLKWRAAKYGVPVKFIESEGGVPQLTGEYDVIIAMDSIEHVKEWREVISVLGRHLKMNGLVFSNNAVLEDVTHPEHYPVYPVEFVSAMAQAQLMPCTQLSYLKSEVTVVNKEVPELVEAGGK